MRLPTAEDSGIQSEDQHIVCRATSGDPSAFAIFSCIFKRGKRDYHSLNHGCYGITVHTQGCSCSQGSVVEVS